MNEEAPATGEAEPSLLQKLQEKIEEKVDEDAEGELMDKDDTDDESVLEKVKGEIFYVYLIQASTARL